MVECSRTDLICLHLAAHGDARGRSPVPRAVTAAGIGEAFALEDTAAERFELLDELRELREDGLVEADERPVEGRSDPRRVYFLTDAGLDRAREVRDRVEDESIRVTDGTTGEVRVADLGQYFEEEPAPLAAALARVDEDGELAVDQDVPETFVDREAVLAAVLESMADAFAGEGGAVLVAGPAGMGKTALVEAALGELDGERGIVAARGTCRTGTSTPYHPLRRAFERVPDDGALVERLDDALAAVTPEDPEEVDAQRTALYSDVEAGLRAAGGDRPVVVFLDNLQWADAATLALFEHLATTVPDPDTRVGFVGTYRPAAVAAADHPLLEVRDRLDEQGALTERHLEPLERSATESLLEGVVGTRDLPAGFVDLVQERTGGVPLFVRETAQHLLEAGAVDPAAGEYPTDPDAVSLAPEVSVGVGERLAALDEESRELVGLAAVAGEHVPGAVLGAASDLPGARLREYLDLLVASRVFERPPGGPGFEGGPAPDRAGPGGEPGTHVRFVSGGLREAVVDELSADRTAEYHERVAESFQAVADGDERAARIAYHFGEAGDHERAVAHYWRAGDHATETYANDVAVEHYDDALAHGAAASDVGEAALAAIAADLADVYRRTGAFDSAIDTVEKYLDVAPPESRERCRLLDVEAEVLVSRGAYGEAQTTAERQRDLAAEIDAEDLQASALDHLGWAFMEQSEYDSARENFKRSRAICREIDDREGEATSLKNVGVVAWKQGDRDVASEYYDRALSIAREIDDRELESMALNNLGTVAWGQNDLESAREYFEESLAIKRDLGDRPRQATTLGNLGVVAKNQGDYDRAREYHERSLEIASEIGDRAGRASSIQNLGAIALAVSSYDRAREYFELSLGLYEELGNRRGEANSRSSLGNVATQQGAYDRAREHYEASLAISRDVGDRMSEAGCLAGLGSIARHQAAYDDARQYEKQGLAIFRDLGNEEGEAGCLSSLGAIAVDEGNHHRAREYLDDALEMFENCDSESGIESVRRHQGRRALAVDDLDRALEYAREAREGYENLGSIHDVGRCRRLMGRVGAGGGPVDAREHWVAALEAFESVGAPDDALTTLELLVEDAREAGEQERASEWLERARGVLSGAPDATAALHRDWVERSGE